MLEATCVLMDGCVFWCCLHARCQQDEILGRAMYSRNSTKTLLKLDIFIHVEFHIHIYELI
jgi:hypothetical protein